MATLSVTRKMDSEDETREKEMAMQNTVEFTVEFRSGYEATARIDRETATTSEYWVEITERQNPYDPNDEPVRVNGVELDGDGAWMAHVDSKLCEAFGITEQELYS